MTDRKAPVLALTGATGFVGRTVLDQAREAGMPVRALTRRPQPEAPGVEWIEGALDQPDSLKRLCEGADAALHIAGVVNAPDRTGFAAGNITGTGNLVRAAEALGVPRLVHVSSLSAREPQLSDYGWSKAEAEGAVAGGALDWAMVRPPAIYGPGDTEVLDLFRMARRGLVLLPPRGRLSVIHVADLGRLLLALARQERLDGALFEPDDGSEGGLAHADFAHALGSAVGRRVLPVHAPAPLLHLAARADRLVRGTGAKLTPDRARYMAHPDWTVDPARRPPAALWTPEVPLAEGLADTARWYREQGWLR